MQQLSIERVVALFTPIFAALAGYITAWVGKHFPGLNIPASDVSTLFIGGATAGAAAALKWLHGRQKFVQATDDVKSVVDQAVDKMLANQQVGPSLKDIQTALRTHSDLIIGQLSKDVKAPPSAEETAQAIARYLFGQGSGSGIGSVSFLSTSSSSAAQPSSAPAQPTPATPSAA